MENFIKHKIMGLEFWQLKAKKGVLPHIFDCQRAQRWPKRTAGERRRRLVMINDLLEPLQSSTSRDGNEGRVTKNKMVTEETADEDTFKYEMVIEETAIKETVKNEIIIEETLRHEMVIEEMAIEERVKSEMVIEETAGEETVKNDMVIEETVSEETVKEKMITETLEENAGNGTLTKVIIVSKKCLFCSIGVSNELLYQCLINKQVFTGHIYFLIALLNTYVSVRHLPGTKT